MCVTVAGDNFGEQTLQWRQFSPNESMMPRHNVSRQIGKAALSENPTDPLVLLGFGEMHIPVLRRLE